MVVTNDLYIPESNYYDDVHSNYNLVSSVLYIWISYNTHSVCWFDTSLPQQWVPELHFGG